MSSKARPPQHVDDSDKTRIRPDLSLRPQAESSEKTRLRAPQGHSDPPESKTQVDIRSGENPKFAAPTVRAPMARPLTPLGPLPTLDLDSTRAMPGGYQPPNLESMGSLPRTGASAPPSPNSPSFHETTATRYSPIATGTPDAEPLPFAEIPLPVQAPPDKSLDRKLMILAGVAVGLVLGAILLNIYG